MHWLANELFHAKRLLRAISTGKWKAHRASRDRRVREISWFEFPRRASSLPFGVSTGAGSFGHAGCDSLIFLTEAVPATCRVIGVRIELLAIGGDRNRWRCGYLNPPMKFSRKLVSYDYHPQSRLQRKCFLNAWPKQRNRSRLMANGRKRRSQTTLALRARRSTPRKGRLIAKRRRSEGCHKTWRACHWVSGSSSKFV